MALNKTKLVADLKAALSKKSTIDNVDTVASDLANAFDAFVKSGKAVGADTGGDTHNLTIQ